MLKRIQQYFNEDIWRIKSSELTTLRARGLKWLRIIVITIWDFRRDRCQQRASGLTYYTLLTLVPVLALAFGIAKGFGLENILERQLRDLLKGQEEIVERIVGFVQALLDKTSGELIAGIGILVLLWSVIRILSNIEETLNSIWHVKKSRTVLRKATDYIAIMTISPIFVILSSSLTVFITTNVRKLANDVEVLSAIRPLIETPLRLLPYAFIWLLLTFLYLVLPNKKVKFSSALIGGIVAGTAYQLLQWGYINSQIGVSNFNAIYGSFAALPLFLIWLQLSWMIVLFGAEMSYAVQNVEKFEKTKEYKVISTFQRKILSLGLLFSIFQRFENDEEPHSVDSLKSELVIPKDIVIEILKELTDAKVIVKIQENKKEARKYIPAKDIHQMDISKIIQLYEKGTDDDWGQFSDNEVIRSVVKRLDKLNEHTDKSSDNILLKDLLKS